VIARAWVAAALFIATAAAQPLGAFAADATPSKPRSTVFVGLDTSGSFRNVGDYDDALTFLAYYIYGHLNAVDGLAQPRELFIAPIGGREGGEPKAFRPIHDLAGKSVGEIEASLRGWFPPTDTLTDFNVFFRQVARIAKERNLQLAPITVVVVSDGIPDVPYPGIKAGSPAMYQKLDLDSLEFLSRNVTVRLLYASPKVGEQWRTHVKRQRVKLWTVEREVMRGWRAQVVVDREPANQARLWKWVRENVDFRVRSSGF
jgi:hypothetical protein